jgi:hypothetical protein
VDFRCPTIHQSQLVQAHSNPSMQIARLVSLQVNSLSFHLVKKIPGHVRIGRGTPDWCNFANCWSAPLVNQLTRDSHVETRAGIRLNYLTVNASNPTDRINSQEPSFTPSVSTVITRIQCINLYILFLGESKDCLNGRQLPRRTRIGSDLCRNARKPYLMMIVSPALVPRPSRQVCGALNVASGGFGWHLSLLP